jgi:NAD(P)-dependent dehydrogenase (short-subunit alcohol dehydrogenase family)
VAEPPAPLRIGDRGLFEGKVALVVGASRGIGAATAMLLARSGAKVMLSARSAKGLDDAADRMRAAGGFVDTIVADIGDESSVERMVTETVTRHGGLDIAVNSAAVALPLTSIVDQTSADYDWIMHVNMRGAFLAMKYELKAMMARGGGSIVNISSIGGLIGSANRSSYVASKHALGGLTKSAALEHAADNIRINAVAPGLTHTDLIKTQVTAHSDQYREMVAAIPMGRAAEPEEIAHSIAWLASDLASFVTGAIVPVDGGFTVP